MRGKKIISTIILAIGLFLSMTAMAYAYDVNEYDANGSNYKARTGYGSIGTATTALNFHSSTWYKYKGNVSDLSVMGSKRVLIVRFRYLIPAFNPYSISNYVGYGYLVHDQKVAELQRALYYLGYITDTKQLDGWYGPVTQKAVINFQNRYGLGADGIVGYWTWAKLSQADR